MTITTGTTPFTTLIRMSIPSVIVYRWGIHTPLGVRLLKSGSVRLVLKLIKIPAAYVGGSVWRKAYEDQSHRFSAANFAKFRRTICEIPRHYYPQIPYIPRPAVGVVVLTNNSSKYEKFILTCNAKTHYFLATNDENIVIMSKKIAII